jgi:CDP-diacylglycerol--serine O-phosphatidyltransferase
MFNVPNFITLLNAFCGSLAVLSLLSGQQHWLPFLIACSLVADFADGLSARLLKANSEIGKELDSLADIISFGLVPGVIFYTLINKSSGIDYLHFDNSSTWFGAIGFVLTLFSALRLAKFNTDQRQTEDFIGLNTPACTIFSLGLLLTIENNSFGLSAWLLSLPVLLSVIVVLSFLLVAEIPIFSLKFKTKGWKGNEARILLIILSILSIILLPIGLALMATIKIYILLSLYILATKKK